MRSDLDLNLKWIPVLDSNKVFHIALISLKLSKFPVVALPFQDWKPEAELEV